MSRRHAAFFVLIALPASLHAQWQFSLLGSSARSTGHAHIQDATEQLEVGPDRPSMLALTASRDYGPWRFGLALHRTTSDLTLRGSETAIVTRGDLAAWGGGVEVGRRILGVGVLPNLYGVLGATRERWTFPVSGGDARTVTVGTAALEGAVPFTPHWSGIVRAEGAVSGSLFGPEELPPGYAVRAGRRLGIGLGVGWRP